MNISWNMHYTNLIVCMYEEEEPKEFIEPMQANLSFSSSLNRRSWHGVEKRHFVTTIDQEVVVLKLLMSPRIFCNTSTSIEDEVGPVVVIVNGFEGKSTQMFYYQVSILLSLFIIAHK